MEGYATLGAVFRAPPILSHLPGEEVVEPSARAFAGLAALGLPIRLAVLTLLMRREADVCQTISDLLAPACGCPPGEPADGAGVAACISTDPSRTPDGTPR